jgi:hypothetical protein
MEAAGAKIKAAETVLVICGVRCSLQLSILGPFLSSADVNHQAAVF